ncbi:ATPase AAA [Pontibacillus halophilus JSM 076056 = DSM 19796]|uniref:ATPase AAA n=1 Tax=Pontibacillus halophilus JSM 076056 = DSM 19796 TaxID=1385510 RepID=A0A0A5GGF5_9BACI|nr:AAA family ATPase [Pontibacillus halophilus]KGX92331.1 ATPase AAA [Pontibacillus halophilus JSM 076056 = DSM 19796]
MRLTDDTAFLKQVTKKEGVVGDSFPLNLPAVRRLETLHFHPNVTYIVGENGMGKSTLLEALAVGLGFNPEGGSMNFSFSNYDSHSNLHESIRIGRGAQRPRDGFFFRAETFYNVATHIEALDASSEPGPRVIDSYGGTSLHEQSHGESFFAAFMNRFGGKGLYILDEPEAALSPLRQLSMLSRIHDLVQDGSQFVISTHAPILMAYPNSRMIQLTSEGMSEVRIEETEHYVIMKQFFDDRERMLHHLFQS